MPPFRRVRVAEATYDEAEIAAVTAVLRDQPLCLVDGPQCAAFEARAAAAMDVAHAVLVNSGSSANLLALAALDLPRGSEVITPALTFGTTVAPLLQLGLVPVFVDVAPGRLVVDPGALEAALGPRTRAVLVPDLVGDVPDWTALRAFADRHDLRLVDDAADTFAPRWAGRATAAHADIGGTSFYASHMLTLAGTGGLVATDDAGLARRVRLLRGWGRRTAAIGEPDALPTRVCTVQGVPYDAKYVFDDAGYNLLPSELGAAFGLAQLDRLPAVRAARARHVAWLAEVLGQWPGWFEVPALPAEVESTWHTFVFRVRDGAPWTREDVRDALEARGIMTRAVLAGNITRHPMLDGAPYRVAGRLDEADAWMSRGLMIGCHQGLAPDDLDHVAGAFRALAG